MTAGRLNSRVRFERRSAKSGGDGGDRFGRAGGAWAAMFGARWAGVSDKTGGETYVGRIEGRQGVEVLVRRDPETETVTMKDRAVVLGANGQPARYLNVRAVAAFPPDPDAFLLLTCEAGGADG